MPRMAIGLPRGIEISATFFFLLINQAQIINVYLPNRPCCRDGIVWRHTRKKPEMQCFKLVRGPQTRDPALAIIASAEVCCVVVSDPMSNITSAEQTSVVGRSDDIIWPGESASYPPQ